MTKLFDVVVQPLATALLGDEQSAFIERARGEVMEILSEGEDAAQLFNALNNDDNKDLPRFLHSMNDNANRLYVIVSGRNETGRCIIISAASYIDMPLTQGPFAGKTMKFPQADE